MDHNRFDDLTRALGTGPASRRRVLRGALAGGAAGLAALVGLRPEAALASPADTVCQAAYNQDPQSIVSKNACPRMQTATRCGANNRGFCVQTVGHVPRCLIGFNPDTGRRQCPSKDQCDGHAQCPNGSYCAKVEGCCGREHNKCLRAVS